MNETWSSFNKAAAAKFGYGINWAVMRYSDVLLMLAETENALNAGYTADAKLALKEVRRRAFAEADRPLKVDAYVDALGENLLSLMLLWMKEHGSLVEKQLESLI